jgi:hypothetical protein
MNYIKTSRAKSKFFNFSRIKSDMKPFYIFIIIFHVFICSSNSNVQPLVIAAHPQEPNQFAVGLSDGGVHVFEPLESEGKWGVPPPNENGSASNNVAVATSVGLSSDQAQR